MACCHVCTCVRTRVPVRTKVHVYQGATTCNVPGTSSTLQQNGASRHNAHDRGRHHPVASSSKGSGSTTSTASGGASARGRASESMLASMPAARQFGTRHPPPPPGCDAIATARCCRKHMYASSQRALPQVGPDLVGQIQWHENRCWNGRLARQEVPCES